MKVAVLRGEDRAGALERGAGGRDLDAGKARSVFIRDLAFDLARLDGERQAESQKTYSEKQPNRFSEVNYSMTVDHGGFPVRVSFSVYLFSSGI
jgi:hypothetical protein